MMQNTHVPSGWLDRRFPAVFRATLPIEERSPGIKLFRVLPFFPRRLRSRAAKRLGPVPQMGSIGLVVAALTLVTPSPSVASTPSLFVARADQTCRQYFAAVTALDRQVRRHLEPANTPQAKIVLTADLLGFNGRLSLNAEARLSRLRAPDPRERLWKSALEADRTAGTLTLHLASQLTGISTSRAADAAVSAYDTKYQAAETTFDLDVQVLNVDECV